jgi:hypothetical protein
MTGQGCSHGWVWEGICPLGSQAQPIIIIFSPQKGFITDINAPQFHQLSRCLVSDDPSGEEAGREGPELRLWGRLDILTNSLKRCWTWLMVDKWRLNSLATALVDIPAVSMPIVWSLKTWDICGIRLCDKTAHFRVAFYCPQHKLHLCNDHAV